MKKINSLLLCLALTLSASTFANAQSAKATTLNNNDEAYAEDVIVISKQGNTVNTMPYLIADHSGFNTFVGYYPVATAPKSFNVWGDNLIANIKVKAPANFQVSFSKNSGYKTTINLVPVGGIVASKKIWVRYTPDTAGTVAVGNIECTSAGADTFLINVAGVAKKAYINCAPVPFAPFSTIAGTPSSEQYYNLTANGIASNLMVTAPAGFEIAFNDFVYHQSLTSTPAYGKIATTAIWVRMKGTTTGHFAGNVTNVASNITRNVHVSGDVTVFKSNNGDETADAQAAERIAEESNDEVGELINYPNPVITTTTISFDLTTATDVKVALYDFKGSEIKVLANSQMQSGVHTLTLDATEFQSGSYLCKVQTGKTIRTLKLVKE
ncbi:MAG: T9SS type A sorting domain-containing protein [Bacteroidia bacterium]